MDSMISASLFSAIGSDGEGAAAGAGASSSLSDDESRSNSAKRFFAPSAPPDAGRPRLSHVI